MVDSGVAGLAPADGVDETAALLRFHDFMRGLYALEEIEDVLNAIAQGVTEVTGFRDAVINIIREDGRIECVAVAGAPELRAALLGRSLDLDTFMAEFGEAEEWGQLRFVPHDRFDGEQDKFSFIPDFEYDASNPDAWHPEDALYAPLNGPDGTLLGILSVDIPPGLVRPNAFLQRLLEMFAVHTGQAIAHAQDRRSLGEDIRLTELVRSIMREVDNVDLDQLVRDSVVSLAHGLSSRAIWLRLVDNDDAEGGLSSIYPPSPELEAPAAFVEMASRAAQVTWAGQHAVSLGEGRPPPPGVLSAEENAAVVGFMRERGFASLLFVPIGAGSEALGYFIAARGVSDLRWSNQELSHALEIGRDLGRAVLNARLFDRERQIGERLRQLDGYKRRLISTISHELKNPLTAIRGHVEMVEYALAEGADDDSHGVDANHSLRVIGRSAERLAVLVDDLLMSMRVNESDRPLMAVPVDLAAALRSAVEMLEMRAHNGAVRIETQVEGDPVLALGEPLELERVVLNLVSNGVKYTKPGGRVDVRLRQEDDRVVLTVRDTGIGISAEDQQSLFSEFFRSNNPEALRVEGTGLGLSIVKRIVDRHAGTIEVASRLGDGTTFTVTLPAAVVP